MTALAELENVNSAEAVEAAFQNIGALDEDGFHPRIVRALYDKFTALHEEAGKLLESHADFLAMWDDGAHGTHRCHPTSTLFFFSASFNPDWKVARTAQGSKRPDKDGRLPGRSRGRGRGKSGRGNGAKKRPAAEALSATDKEVAQGVQDQLEDLFGETAASRGVQHLLRSDIGVSETPPCTLNTGAPGTPPEVASRFAIMIEKGILPSTTLEQRRRNSRTSGTNYGVPEGLSEALYYEDEEPASTVRCCCATGGFIAAVLFCAACPCS
ncbi:hypothetical protein AK812_SmicGene23307 [Symbiodinium microadriaticum]|uniref:Uncharacterized protein n=1 Tax=Symbiodinium microadriaticum TaxID=2951 RepID=A0A1Q9DHJ4_SYMMI|nr:hypothetical protein AK812_SmicGene23307 [Symbiodinium microadriaticum]CAE7876366.1 unnamed protein product [Symbiodinium microadriaticum]